MSDDHRIEALREIERRLALHDRLLEVERRARRLAQEGLTMSAGYIRVRHWKTESADPYLNLLSALEAVAPLHNPLRPERQG